MCYTPFAMEENDKTIQAKRSDANTIAVYTAMRILLEMRHQLGFEAMLEYIDRYLGTVESCTPEMKLAVTKALSLINVKSLYADFRPYEKN